MPNARGRKHTIAIGWGVELAKVCQIHFLSNGTILVTFPYQPESPGLAARLKILPGKMTYQFADEFSRVTSHKVKYSHPPDGRAHFSGTGKIRTDIWAEGAPVLQGDVGHFFTLHLRGIDRFTELSIEELRDPCFHTLEFQADYVPSLRLVGRFLTVPDSIDVDEPGKTVVRAKFGRSPVTDAMVLAPEAGTPLDGHAVFLQCVEQEPLNRDEPFHLSFQGGFEIDMADPSAESSMLVLNYPGTQSDTFASMDLEDFTSSRPTFP